MLHSILAVDRNYEPHRWITTDDAITLEAKDLVQDHLGEAVIVYRGGVSRMTGVETKIETSSIIVIKGAPNPRKYKDPALTNASLFQRDRCICAYCGGLFKANELTRDHIYPQSKGGRDVWMNVVTACKGCNSLKEDILPGEKLRAGVIGPQGTGKMDPLYVPYVPCKAEHMLLKNKHIKADQMMFLLDRIVHKDVSRVYQDGIKQLEIMTAA